MSSILYKNFSIYENKSRGIWGVYTINFHVILNEHPNDVVYLTEETFCFYLNNIFFLYKYWSIYLFYYSAIRYYTIYINMF